MLMFRWNFMFSTFMSRRNNDDAQTKQETTILQHINRLWTSTQGQTKYWDERSIYIELLANDMNNSERELAISAKRVRKDVNGSFIFDESPSNQYTLISIQAVEATPDHWSQWDFKVFTTSPQRILEVDEETASHLTLHYKHDAGICISQLSACYD